jgi:hypothetical protein
MEAKQAVLDRMDVWKILGWNYKAVRELRTE